MCECFACVYVYTTTCVPSAHGGHKTLLRSLGTGVTDRFELLSSCQELNPNPLQSKECSKPLSYLFSSLSIL